MRRASTCPGPTRSSPTGRSARRRSRRSARAIRPSPPTAKAIPTTSPSRARCAGGTAMPKRRRALAALRRSRRRMSAFKDHFSTRSAEYAAYRPTYPRALVDFLADAAPDTELALDCGCGTGQLRCSWASALRASSRPMRAKSRSRTRSRTPVSRTGSRRRKRAASATQAPTSSLPRRRRIGSTFRPSTPRRGAWRARGDSSRS